MALIENLPAQRETLDCDCKTGGARPRVGFASVLKAIRSMHVNVPCAGAPESSHPQEGGDSWQK
jgi:hypothetical protein